MSDKQTQMSLTLKDAVAVSASADISDMFQGRMSNMRQTRQTKENIFTFLYLSITFERISWMNS